MSTIKNYSLDLPTLPFDETPAGSMGNSSNCSASDAGASEARRLTDPSILVKGTQHKNHSGELGANQPEFSPAFVKIPFEDIELGDCCGEGSFGTVYVGKWTSQNRTVAVKTLNRMDEEVRILSTLSHRNIIQFYGACCEIPNCCLVTEYAPYGSLYGFLSSSKSEQLEYNQMLTWARDVALGMNYLHEEAPIQVVHRDLKSKNVLICNDFCLKICDFGASRVFDETTVMTITGTYPWMAPELIQGLPTSELCDVYSFGVVLWELLTKEVPFKGLQGFQVAWNVVEKKERPLIPTTCPKQLSKLMEKCWHADSLERPPFCDIVVDLSQMLSDTELEKETDSFVHTKGDWIMEVKDKLKDIRQQESKLEAEKNNVEKREEIMKKWAERLEDELRQKSLFNFQFSSSFNCEYSETSRTSRSNVKEAVNRMMFSSGLHRHSREEKFGVRVEASSPNTASSPLIGVPLSRQGSTSSMESSRSMSIQSDMTYDMSKVNIDLSPVSGMDPGGTEGFPFPKARDMQGSSRSRMKLQRQMSASSEEIQYEGLKLSRESTPSNGEMRSLSEWEKSASKSRTNEAMSKSSENFFECRPRSRDSCSERVAAIPSIDILEKALQGMNLDKLPAAEVPTIAARLRSSLEVILRDTKASSSPSPTDELDCNGVRGMNQLAKKASPSCRNVFSSAISQKPPISCLPSRITESDDPCNTVRQRPGKNVAKTVETQTVDCSSNPIARKEFGTQTLTSSKNFENYFNLTPSIERACTDAHKSGAREYITLRISRNSPLESFQPVTEHEENSAETICGQIHDNAISRRDVSLNGISAVPKKSGALSRPRPPKSLSLDQASPPKNDNGETSRHIAARHIYLSGRSSSAVEQQSNIFETDDFTYIIQPNRRRR